MRGRRFIAFAVVIALMALAPLSHAQKRIIRRALAPGEEAPKLIGWAFDQSLQTLKYDGVYTLVNFWATWCEPCRHEMPKLQELANQFGEQGLRIVGFNQEPKATVVEVQEHLDALGVTYINLKPDARWNWGSVQTLPTSFLVGPDGKIMRKYIGAKPEQLAGLARDLEDAVNGRELKAMILPKPKPREAEKP